MAAFLCGEVVRREGCGKRRPGEEECVDGGVMEEAAPEETEALDGSLVCGSSGIGCGGLFGGSCNCCGGRGRRGDEGGVVGAVDGEKSDESFQGAFGDFGAFVGEPGGDKTLGERG